MTGFPNALVAQAWFDRNDIEKVLENQSQYDLTRSIRHKPKSTNNPNTKLDNIKGSLNDPLFRSGYSLLKKHLFSSNKLSTECTIRFWLICIHNFLLKKSNKPSLISKKTLPIALEHLNKKLY